MNYSEEEIQRTLEGTLKVKKAKKYLILADLIIDNFSFWM